MRFALPQIAGLLWLVPLAGLFFIVAGRARRKAMLSFAEQDLLTDISASFSRRKRRFRSWLLLFAVLFMVISLMRPQWGYSWREVKRRGLDIMIALDTSKSMLAEDVLPNRLERSKLAIKDLVEKLKGDRVGLVVFSGTAFLQCPLTLDYSGFLLTLDDVDVNTIPVGGTSLSNAIYRSLDSFEGSKGDKILVIITDGEDLEGGVEEAVQKARLEDVMIYCVGIGSQEGELIPVRTGNGKMAFLKDSKGNVVRTRLEENTLQRIALATGGMYVRATGAQFGLDLIYDEKLSKLEKQELKSRMEKNYFERFQIPLVIAFLLLLIEPLIGDRRRTSGGRSGRK